ncbi:MAG: hypothetical protein FJZ96_12265 [Chloroflexi bacterium]|nr:hypothetical protein [Chloroflexota bacterium]
MNTRPRKPIPVTLLAWLVLILTASNLLRAAGAVAFQETLAAYNATVTPAYILLSGLFWGASGGLLSWSLWLRMPWSGKMLAGWAAGYGCWYWFDRLALQAPPPNTVFALGVTGFLALLLLSAFLPANRRWFEK